MKEIKFKAKRKDNNEWVYGYYWKEHNNACFAEEYKEKHYIRVQQNFDWGIYMQQDFEVIPETICEYTGLKDKNGVEIYENDLLQHKSIYSDKIGKDIVFFNEDYGTFEVAINGNKSDSEVLGFYLSRLSIDTKYEVIGTKFDKEVK